MRQLSLNFLRNERLQETGVLVAAILLGLLSGFGSHVEVGLEAVILVSLIGISWIKPWPAALALFPILISFPPAPVSIGMREMLVGSFLLSLFLSSLLHYRDRTLALFTRLEVKTVCIICAVLVAVNFAVGRLHGVPIGDWIRGLLPFCFIAYCFPLAAVLTHENRVRLMGVSVLVLSTLIAFWVLYEYASNPEYRPFFHSLDHQIPRTTSDFAPKFDGSSREPIFTRITGRVPFATDVALPLGTVISAIAWVQGRQRHIRHGALAVAGITMAAILVTYTRSMLATVVVSLLVAISISVWEKDLVRLRRWMSCCAVLLCVAAGVINWFSIAGAWTGRFESMVSYSPSLQQSELEQPCGGNDCNLTSRVEEYRIAWRRFMANPISGRGLGERHEIVMQSDEGNMLQNVGYIHNWVLYFLMCGGIPFFAAYSYLLFSPAILAGRVAISAEIRYGVLASTLVIASYAMFFAVFRLITFNLILALMWAVPLSGQLSLLSEAKFRKGRSP